MVSLFFSFKGRITRLAYWGFFFLRLPVYLTLAAIPYSVGESNLALLLVSPILFAVLYAEIAVTVKRLHDTNRSGFSLLWGLIPIIGALYLFIVCGFLRYPYENRYGDPPESIMIPLIKELLSVIPLSAVSQTSNSFSAMRSKSPFSIPDQPFS